MDPNSDSVWIAIVLLKHAKEETAEQQPQGPAYTPVQNTGIGEMDLQNSPLNVLNTTRACVCVYVWLIVKLPEKHRISVGMLCQINSNSHNQHNTHLCICGPIENLHDANATNLA